MTTPIAPVTSVPSEPQDVPSESLHGWILILTRVIWVLVALLSVGMYIASVPLAYAAIASFSYPRQFAPAAVRLGLAELGIAPTAYARYWMIQLSLGVAVFVGVGILIFWRKGQDRAALFFSLVLITFGAIWPNTFDALVAQYPTLLLVSQGLNAFGFLSFFLLGYVFPDGRFVPRWTRWVALWFVVTAIGPTFFSGTPFIDSNTWPAWLNLANGLTIFATLILAQVYRFRHVSIAVQRQQTKWIVFSLVIALVCFITTGTLETLATFNQPGVPAVVFDVVRSITYGLAFMLVPIAIGVAVLRYRLWDIDPIINRTLVYAGLTVGVVAMYVLIVTYLGNLFRTGSNLAISLLATGVVAVAFQPIRDWLQRIVNRLMYGDRDEPYAVMTRLGQRLESTLAPDAILPTIVQTTKDALKLPYVAIALQKGDAMEIMTELGQPQPQVLRVPLAYRAETLGALVVAPRAVGEAFSPADQRLLALLAQQAGIATYAVRLSDDLQHSRERLVTTREEERRRLRRDLHDGLGPTIAAQTIRVGTARYLIKHDPTAAEELLTELEVGLVNALAEVRQVVYNLRPPALDELGLVGAIRTSAAHYQSPGTHENSLAVTVDAPDALPLLPAAVEVAAYRIIHEAMTNVIRHAQATLCRIELAMTEQMGHSLLDIQITDNGCGLPPERRAGVGLQAMRERATEVGGSWSITASAQGGTRVQARLPINPHLVSRPHIPSEPQPERL